MYKESNKISMTEGDSNIENILHKRSLKRFDAVNHWHNQFLENVVNKVDESFFIPLFNEKMGAPNVPIRQLIGISILKEGFGISDEQMFEQVQFHLLVRKALGIIQMSDPGPSIDVYYFFRRRIVDYERENGIDLYKLCFESITKSQVLKFKVEGKSIRMDSKLIGSNIAWYSRFQIIHETVLMSAKDLSIRQLHCLKKEDRITHQALLEEPAQQLVYTETAEAIEKRLTELGYLIYGLLMHFPDSLPYYQLLKRVFNEQFIVENKRVIPRNKKDISAQSVQNPHDPDATYRRKENKKVKGYSTNITETCDSDGLNLIINVQVKNVSAADNGFFEQAITESQENVLSEKIKKAHLDGAYHSVSNRVFADKELMKLYLTGLQGKPPRFILEQTESGLQVIDTQTGEIKIVEITKKRKWRIKIGRGYRYFSQKDIETAVLRKELENTPAEETKKRNNVEASIFQYCFHTRNNKTRYRGLIKHKLFSYARCLWINLVRIAIYQIKTCLGTPLIEFLKLILLLKIQILQILTKKSDFQIINSFYINLMSNRLSYILINLTF